VYTPQQKIALGEGMLAWRAHLRFRVYNPAKITKYGIMVRMVCESTTGYICKLLLYDASGMILQDSFFELLNPYVGQRYSVHSIQFFPIVSKAKPPGKKSHLNFMQTVSRNFFQGTEMNSPAVSASAAASDTTSLASTDLPKEPRLKTPHFVWTAKEKNSVAKISPHEK
jgi:hypothetical protein